MADGDDSRQRCAPSCERMAEAAPDEATPPTNEGVGTHIDARRPRRSSTDCRVDFSPAATLSGFARQPIGTPPDVLLAFRRTR